MRDTTLLQQASQDISNSNETCTIHYKSRICDDIERENTMILTSQETLAQPTNLSEWLESNSYGQGVTKADKAFAETLRLIRKRNNKQQPHGFSIHSVKKRWKKAMQIIKIHQIKETDIKPKPHLEEYNWILQSVKERILRDINTTVVADRIQSPIFYGTLNQPRSQKSFFSIESNNLKIIDFLKHSKYEWFSLFINRYQDQLHKLSRDSAHLNDAATHDNENFSNYHKHHDDHSKDNFLNDIHGNSFKHLNQLPPWNHFKGNDYTSNNQVDQNRFVFTNQFIYQMITSQKNDRSASRNNSSKKKQNEDKNDSERPKKMKIGINLNIILEKIFNGDKSLKHSSTVVISINY